ncbi:MAG TPA: hypothetical protein VI385_12040 [Flavisolibacter sp.]
MLKNYFKIAWRNLTRQKGYSFTVPIAWFVISKWLQSYAFRINIHWTYFVLPFVTIVIIALLTVSFQSIEAAVANPVKSLRTE